MRTTITRVVTMTNVIMSVHTAITAISVAGTTRTTIVTTTISAITCFLNQQHHGLTTANIQTTTTNSCKHDTNDNNDDRA